MKSACYFLIVAAALVFLGSQPASSDARTWNPYRGVDELLIWFDNLNSRFDKIVDVEQRAQLIRSIDRIRKDLYIIEADTHIIIEMVGQNDPEGDDRKYMIELSEKLLTSILSLRNSVKQVGADIRLQDETYNVEQIIIIGLIQRKKTVTVLQSALSDGQIGNWNSSNIKKHLSLGLESISKAQLTVTNFRRELTK